MTINVRRAREIAAEYGMAHADSSTVLFAESARPPTAKDLAGLADEVWLAIKVQGMFNNDRGVSQLQRLQEWVESEARLRKVQL